MKLQQLISTKVLWTIQCLYIQVFVIGAVAQFTLSNRELGSFLSINISSGLGVTFGIFWSFGVSGMYVTTVSFNT